MPLQESKKKRIVFNDTDIRHAQLKIRLQQDNLSQTEFFRTLITGYIEKDGLILKFIDNYKEKNNLQSKRKRKFINNDQARANDIMSKFGIKDEDLENIFDLIAEEHPDL